MSIFNLEGDEPLLFLLSFINYAAFISLTCLAMEQGGCGGIKKYPESIGMRR